MDHIHGTAGARSRSSPQMEEEEEGICNIRNIPPSPSPSSTSAMIFIDSGALLREGKHGEQKDAWAMFPKMGYAKKIVEFAIL